MIRIHTKLNNDRVYTFQYNKKWFTLAEIKKERFTIDGVDLYEAGHNHLHYVKIMRTKNEV
ncbi:MAG TPA: hypothetical protein VII94_05535 [Candidatus Saccharimonadales bacterium]